MLALKRHREPDEIVSKIQSDRWDLATPGSYPTYPDSKLKTDNLDDYTLFLYGQRRSHTTITAFFNNFLSETLDIGLIGVLNVNRQYPTRTWGPYGAVTYLRNQARLTIDDFAPNSFNLGVASGSFSLTNLTGAYSILNQMLNPPETDAAYSPSKLTKVSDSSNTVINLLFDNFLTQRPLEDGEDLQELQVHTVDSVDPLVRPTIETVLRQETSTAGVYADIATLTAYEIEKTSHGFIYKYLFDSSIFPSNTARIGARITGTTTGTSTPEYYAVKWYGSVTGQIYNSGWQDIIGSNVVWAPEVDFPYAALYVTVEFSDFAYKTLDGFGHQTYTPLADTFYAGRFVGGAALNLPLRDNNAFNVRRLGNNEGNMQSTYGGQLRALRPDMTRKQVDMTTIPQPAERFYAEIEPWAIQLGNVEHSLFVDNSRRVELVDYRKLLHPEALWGVVRSFECPDIGMLMGSDGESTEPPHSEDKYHIIMVSVIQSKADLTRRES